MNLDFKKLDGLIATVVIDHQTGRVLMVGFMNEEAWHKTLETGAVTFYSRSRNKLWMKGETSGHKLLVKEIRTDCDQDVLWLKATISGAGVACHTGARSCFYRIVERAADPSQGAALIFADAKKTPSKG